MSKKTILVAIVLGILAVAVILPRLGGVAPKPGMFGEVLTLAAALDRSEKTGRPVLAVVTADWCGACQALKRGTLSRPEVESLVADSFVPVYIDADDMPGEVAQIGGVEYLPTSVVIARGREIARAVGNQPARDYLAMLRDALARSTPAD